MKTTTTTTTKKQKQKQKKREESYAKVYFFFITIFPWGGALDCWAVASEDPWSVPLRSPLVGIGKVARTISILDASLYLVGP